MRGGHGKDVGVAITMLSTPRVGDTVVHGRGGEEAEPDVQGIAIQNFTEVIATGPSWLRSRGTTHPVTQWPW